jgi:ATP-dependent Clp protease adaptor protein ClpS
LATGACVKIYADMKLSAIFDKDLKSFPDLNNLDLYPYMIGATPERPGPDPETDSDTDLDIAIDDDTELEPPYRVIIHNDSITTFVFVIKILTTIFMKNVMEADQIANRTHRNGIAVVGTYPESIADIRINKVHFAAQLEGYPLKLTKEPAE